MFWSSFSFARIKELVINGDFGDFVQERRDSKKKSKVFKDAREKSHTVELKLRFLQEKKAKRV